MTNAPEPKQLSLAEALLPLAGLILLVGLSYYLFGDRGSSGPNQVALVVATMIAVAVARRRGFSFEVLSDAAITSVGSGIGAIFILFAVGALIGTWAMSGTLVAMVYYGMKVLDPNYFYVTAATLCAAVAFGIGSSWTVVGTIGIGLMGVAISMDLNPGIAAAAIISGAYFGDTTSPLSSSTHLAAGAASANFYDHIRETIISSAIALTVALFVFWFFGQASSYMGTADKAAAIAGSFHITLWLFLPLLVVIVLALFKLPPFTTIFMGALAGGVMAVIISPERVLVFAAADESIPTALALLKGIWLALASGYTSSTGVPALDALASRGGMSSMLNTIWLVITAFAFGGVIEKTGMLDRLIGPVITMAKTTTALVASLVGSVIATNIATADQYLAVVLPGRMFKGAFERRGLAEVVLSRSIGASATPTSALIPWNSCGAYMAATLGVSTFDYLPYAVFNYTNPLLPILAALFGIRMFKRTG